jgi:aminopeptidase N
MASNLTRDEARERARLLTVQSYQVELDLTVSELTFRSVSVVRFRAEVPGSATFIDLAAPDVREIVLNGHQLDLAAVGGDRIALAGLAAENELRVVADCAYSRTGEGLHRFIDPADKDVYLYSNLETSNAHEIYACFDQPDLKATYELTVTGQDNWQVISNMPADGEPEPAGPGRLRWHFPPTPLLPTYITAVMAGPYHAVRAEHRGIPLGIFCRQSLARYLDPDEIFEITRQGLDFYSGQFGLPYPFPKYDQLFVPEFNAGAMETPGAVTFVEAYIFRSRVTDGSREARASTILHEMAHMWFGDLVTMRWWDDLWLNESFATWAAAVAESESTRWASAWTVFAQYEKAWAYRQDQLPSTHPVAADIPDIAAVEVNFDGITYAKGAAVLKQLVAYVGRDNFLAGLRQYFDAHRWGNATLADLLGALERESGRELAPWSRAWLQTAGVNTLRPEFTVGAAGRLTSFAVLQEAPADHPELRPHRIAIGLYEQGEHGLRRVHRAEADIAGARTEIPELAGQARPALILVNDDDLTYAKVRLDEDSLLALTTARGRFAESLPAAICWAAAWDMVRDGELRPRDYLSLVLAGAEHITDAIMLRAVLMQATSAIRRYADPSWRPEGLARLAAACREAMHRAPAGSDAQLIYVRTFAGAATQPGDLAVVAGLLDGTTVLDGLAVDTDLRWELVLRLAANGAADENRIEAELDRDRTDAGERHAATARASIPSPEGKARTWAEIVGGELPNAMFRATLDGFQDADRPALLAPFAEPYYDVVGRLWDSWSTDMAQHFASGAYPVTAISREALARADHFLAEAQPPAALRRLVAEGRDDVARALRCRERDAAANGANGAVS